jgi:DNA-binding MarR family transcriptional regulator
MAKIDAAKIWTLKYRLSMSLIVNVTPELTSAFGIGSKELFLLAEIDAHPYPAELAVEMSMPKPTVTMIVKHLEAQGFVRREIDAADLRRHRLVVTPAGRKVASRGMTMLSDAYAARLARLSTAEQSELQRLLEKLS